MWETKHLFAIVWKGKIKTNNFSSPELPQTHEWYSYCCWGIFLENTYLKFASSFYLHRAFFIDVYHTKKSLMVHWFNFGLAIDATTRRKSFFDIIFRLSLNTQSFIFTQNIMFWLQNFAIDHWIGETTLISVSGFNRV